MYSLNVLISPLKVATLVTARTALAALVLLLTTFSLTGAREWETRHVDSHDWPVTAGIVTSLGPKYLHIQRYYSNIKLQLTPTTRIIRLVDGSSADLQNGEYVDISESGGTAISITIDPPGTPHNSAGSDHDLVSGTVQSVSAGTITVQTSDGHNVTLILPAVPRVTKEIQGTTADLAIGEYVRACYDFHNRALSISIVHA